MAVVERLSAVAAAARSTHPHDREVRNRVGHRDVSAGMVPVLVGRQHHGDAQPCRRCRREDLVLVVVVGGGGGVCWW